MKDAISTKPLQDTIPMCKKANYATQQLHEPPAGFDLASLRTRSQFAQNATLTLRHRRVGLDVGLGYVIDHFPILYMLLVLQPTTTSTALILAFQAFQ